MSIKRVLNCCLLLLVVYSQGIYAADYLQHPLAQKWLQQMLAEGFTKEYLSKVLSTAKRKDSILKALARPAEARKSWQEYRSGFIRTKGIQNGNKFWQKHARALARAEREFGVPAQLIVSIIGVETRYGKVTGSYRVVDALATIGFDNPRRGEYFRNQLKEFLILCREEKLSFDEIKGSYAGAMGIGQFLPSSFRKYAIDFDGDGKKDIWKNPVDAIGSVANYFAEHGWLTDQPVVISAKVSRKIDKEWYNNGLDLKVTLQQWRKRSIGGAERLNQRQKATLMKLIYDKKDQYWFGLQNFYVITRYNRSRFYAMAVFQLSELIKAENKLS
ncbi:MAG: lytic murein transglycosylase B [Pseudomonadales bacterium]|nr:lytic murein transglycosylase B [Pseudomonadales bacterium]NRA15324.1 lytic murein transglycosylase B [Oceanospirillaceae bacterium]